MSTQTDAQTMPLDAIVRDIERRDWGLDVTRMRWAEVYLVGVNRSFESAPGIEDAIRKAYRTAIDSATTEDEAA